MATINKHYGPLTATQSKDFYDLPVDTIKDALDTRKKAFDDTQDKYLAGKQNLMIKTRPLESDKSLLNSVIGEYQNKVNETVMNNYGGDWSQASPEIKDLAYKYANDDRMWALTKAKEKDDAWLAFKEKHPETAYDFTTGEKTDIIVNDDGTTKGPEYKYESLLNWNDEMRKYFKDVETDAILRTLPQYVDEMATKDKSLVWKNKQAELKPVLERLTYLKDNNLDPSEQDKILQQIKSTYKFELKQNEDKINAVKKEGFNSYTRGSVGQNQFRIYEDKMLKSKELDPTSTKEEREAAVLAKIQQEFDAIGDSYAKSDFTENVTYDTQEQYIQGKPKPVAPTDLGKTKTDGGSGDDAKDIPVEVSNPKMTTLESTNTDVLDAAQITERMKTPYEAGFDWFSFTPEQLKTPGSISSLSGVMLAATLAPGQIPNKDVQSNLAKAIDTGTYEILPLGVASETGKQANPAFVNTAHSLYSKKKEIENLKAYLSDGDYKHLQWMKDAGLLTGSESYDDIRNKLNKEISKYADEYNYKVIQFNKHNGYYYDFEEQPEGKDWKTYIAEKLINSQNITKDLQDLNNRFNIPLMVYTNDANGTGKTVHPFLSYLAKEHSDYYQKPITDAIENYNTFANDGNNSAFINADVQAISNIDLTRQKLKTVKNQMTGILKQSGSDLTYDSYLKLETKVKTLPETQVNLKKFDKADLDYFDAAYANDNDTTRDYAADALLKSKLTSNQFKNGYTDDDRLKIYREAMKVYESGDKSNLIQTFKNAYYSNPNVQAALKQPAGLRGFEFPSDVVWSEMADAYIAGLKPRSKEALTEAQNQRTKDYSAAYSDVTDPEVKQYFGAYETLRKSTLYHDYQANYKQVYYTDEKSAGNMNEQLRVIINNGIMNDLNNNWARKSLGFNSAKTEKFDSTLIDKEWYKYQQEHPDAILDKKDWLFGKDGKGGKIQGLGFSTEAVDGSVYGYTYEDNMGIKHSLEMNVNGSANTVLDNGVAVRSGIDLLTENSFNLFGLNSLKTMMLKDISQQFVDSDGLFAAIKLGGQSYDLVKTNSEQGGYLALFIDGELKRTDKPLVTIQDFYDYYSANKNPDLERANYLKSRLDAYDDAKATYKAKHPKLSDTQIDNLLQSVGTFKDFNYKNAKDLYLEVATEASKAVDGVSEFYKTQLGKDENGVPIYLGLNKDGKPNEKFAGSYVSRAYNRGLGTDGLAPNDPHVIPEGASLSQLTSGSSKEEIFLLRKDNQPYIRFSPKEKTLFNGTTTTKPNIVVTKSFGGELWDMFDKASNSSNLKGKRVTITSSLRSLQDQDDIKDTNGNSAGATNNSLHFLGEAIDVSLRDDAGESFGDWCQTDEGRETLKNKNIRVLVHGNPKHIHIEHNAGNPGWECEQSIADEYKNRGWKTN